MSESSSTIRAKLAAEKRWRPDSDVSALRAKAAEQLVAEKVRQLAENLSHEQRLRVARILTETNADSGSGQ